MTRPVFIIGLYVARTYLCCCVQTVQTLLWFSFIPVTGENPFFIFHRFYWEFSFYIFFLCCVWALVNVQVSLHNCYLDKMFKSDMLSLKYFYLIYLMSLAAKDIFLHWIRILIMLNICLVYKYEKNSFNTIYQYWLVAVPRSIFVYRYH